MRSENELESLRQLVPFYVNGSLGTAEKRAFEEALPEHPELRSELERETKLQARFVKEMEVAMRPDRKKNGAKPDDELGEINTNGLAKALSFLNPKNWNPAVTFALAAAAVGQTAIIGSQSSTISDLEAENYQLASGQTDCEDTATIVLEPAGETDWAALNALIATEGLSITGGGAGGPLMLRHREDEDLGAILERLEASDLVASVAEAT